MGQYDQFNQLVRGGTSKRRERTFTGGGPGVNAARSRQSPYAMRLPIGEAVGRLAGGGLQVAKTGADVAKDGASAAKAVGSGIASIGSGFNQGLEAQTTGVAQQKRKPQSHQATIDARADRMESRGLQRQYGPLANEIKARSGGSSGLEQPMQGLMNPIQNSGNLADQITGNQALPYSQMPAGNTTNTMSGFSNITPVGNYGFGRREQNLGDGMRGVVYGDGKGNIMAGVAENQRALGDGMASGILREAGMSGVNPGGGGLSIAGRGGPPGMSQEQWDGLSQDQALAIRLGQIEQDRAAVQGLNQARQQAAGGGLGQQGQQRQGGITTIGQPTMQEAFADFAAGRVGSEGYKMFRNLRQGIRSATATHRTSGGQRVQVHTPESKALQGAFAAAVQAGTSEPESQGLTAYQAEKLGLDRAQLGLMEESNANQRRKQDMELNAESEERAMEQRQKAMEQRQAQLGAVKENLRKMLGEGAGAEQLAQVERINGELDRYAGAANPSLHAAGLMQNPDWLASPSDFLKSPEAQKMGGDRAQIWAQEQYENSQRNYQAFLQQIMQ